VLFHTWTFLIFFAIFLPCYLFARRSSRHILVIVLFSQVFYGWWDWRFLILLWITILVDYFIAQLIERSESPGNRRLLLLTSIGSNVLLLAFFKYWNLVADLIGSASQPAAAPRDLHIVGLIVPVGISFYTFQSMSYTIDVYRRQHPAVRNLVEYASFVCYFPHMVAGPIQRIHQLLPRILRPQPFTFDRVGAGVLLFAYGFFCKAVGDTLASLHDPVFAHLSESDPTSVTVAVVSFGVQIYVDFLGYTEMARGVSRILGIELMRNFRAPYTACSFREFWQRWHISLSTWLRDYLYIPLGGSRVPTLWHYRNLFLTMLIGGLWHGAGLNFLIWGGLHGIYLILNNIFAKRLSAFSNQHDELRLVLLALGWAITMVGVFYAWIYFRIPTFGDALVANQKILASITDFQLPTPHWDAVASVALILGYDLLRRNAADSIPTFVATSRRSLAFGLAAGALFSVGLLMFVGRPAQQFIYFQF
jgi:alginate O-acetyltransferase complex protein AlgI